MSQPQIGEPRLKNNLVWHLITPTFWGRVETVDALDDQLQQQLLQQQQQLL